MTFCEIGCSLWPIELHQQAHASVEYGDRYLSGTQAWKGHVYSIASGEKGKMHTIVVCVSASGNAIPPLMIYPSKRAVPESM